MHHTQTRTCVSVNVALVLALNTASYCLCERSINLGFEYCVVLSM